MEACTGRVALPPSSAPQHRHVPGAGNLQSPRAVNHVGVQILTAPSGRPARHRRTPIRSRRSPAAAQATAYEAVAPARGRHRDAQMETGGGGWGGGWGGGGGAGKPPQGGNEEGGDGGGGGGGELTGNPFQRVVVSVRSRLEGDCWMWARLAFAAAADVAAVAAIARRGRSGEWLRSEAFLSQAVVAVLGTLVVGLLAAPAPAARVAVARREGGLGAAPLFAALPRSSRGEGLAPAHATKQLLRQAARLGVVGAATGWVGAVSARALALALRPPRHCGSGPRPVGSQGSPEASAQGGSDHRSTAAQQLGEGNLSGSPPGAAQPAPAALQVALRRAAFMAVSTNARHAMLHAVDTALQGTFLCRPAAVAVSAAAHSANTLLAAWQWRRVVDGADAAVAA